MDSIFAQHWLETDFEFRPQSVKSARNFLNMDPLNAPSPVRYELPGSYRENAVQVERIVADVSNKVFVNLHGTYGIMHGNS